MYFQLKCKHLNRRAHTTFTFKCMDEYIFTKQMLCNNVVGGIVLWDTFTYEKKNTVNTPPYTYI